MRQPCLRSECGDARASQDAAGCPLVGLRVSLLRWCMGSTVSIADSGRQLTEIRAGGFMQLLSNEQLDVIRNHDILFGMYTLLCRRLGQYSSILTEESGFRIGNDYDAEYPGKELSAVFEWRDAAALALCIETSFGPLSIGIRPIETGSGIVQFGRAYGASYEGTDRVECLLKYLSAFVDDWLAGKILVEFAYVGKALNAWRMLRNDVEVARGRRIVVSFGRARSLAIKRIEPPLERMERDV